MLIQNKGDGVFRILNPMWSTSIRLFYGLLNGTELFPFNMVILGYSKFENRRAWYQGLYLGKPPKGFGNLAWVLKGELGIIWYLNRRLTANLIFQRRSGSVCWAFFRFVPLSKKFTFLFANNWGLVYKMFGGNFRDVFHKGTEVVEKKGVFNLTGNSWNRARLSSFKKTLVG